MHIRYRNSFIWGGGAQILPVIFLIFFCSDSSEVKRVAKAIYKHKKEIKEEKEIVQNLLDEVTRFISK